MQHLNHPTRRRLRLLGHDYSAPGAYFITICTAHRAPILADIVACRVRLTPAGRIVAAAWRVILSHQPDVRLVAGVIMPDHLHVVLLLRPNPTPRKSVCRLVGAMKTYSAARINRSRGTPARPVWQRSFYDRIIWDRSQLARCCTYIANNPRHWDRRGRRARTAPTVRPASA